MPTEEAVYQSKWQSFNDIILENLLESLLYFLMIDQLMAGNKTDVDKEKLREEIFGANGIFPLNSDYDAYGKSGFHPWHIDDLRFIQWWNTHWASYFRQQIQERYEH